MRRVVALGALLVLAGACGDGSATGPKVLGATFERASVVGLVRRDGVPAIGARVSLGDTGRTTFTDAAGSYRFEAVDAGTYRLVATDPGDNTPVCSPSGACVTARSSRHATVDVVVAEDAVTADVDL